MDEFLINAPEEVLLYEDEIQHLIKEELLHFEQVSTAKAKVEYLHANPARRHMSHPFPNSLMKGFHHLIAFYLEDVPEIEISHFRFVNTAFHSSQFSADIFLYGEI